MTPLVLPIKAGNSLARVNHARGLELIQAQELSLYLFLFLYISINNHVNDHRYVKAEKSLTKVPIYTYLLHGTTVFQGSRHLICN